MDDLLGKAFLELNETLDLQLRKRLVILTQHETSK